MKNPPEKLIQTMIWDYLDGELSELEEKKLQAILKVDPFARKQYLRCTTMHSVLGWEHVSREEIPLEVTRQTFHFIASPITPVFQWLKNSATIPLGMAASFLALFSLLGLYFLKQENHEREKIALEKVISDKEPIGWVSHGNGASIIFADADASKEDTGFFYSSDIPEQNGMSLVLHFTKPFPETDEG